MGLTIKDAPLVENVADEIKFPVSDGSNKPKAASVGQIGEHISRIFAKQLADVLNEYVKKVEGKDLSTNDFTNDFKDKLEGLYNYDDTDVKEGITKLRTDLDTLVSGDTTTAIKTFNEVIAFLNGIEDSQSLDSIIASIEQQIAAKAGKSEIPTKVSQLENDVPYVKEDVVPNGVYAVDANNKLIDYNTADSSCLGVALVAGEHKFMITKADATDGTNTTLYWDKDYSDLSLTNYLNTDGTNRYGYFGGTSAPQLNKDFTTWTAGALSDFNGKANTAIIAAASSDARDMCTVLNTFNAADIYNDWYVPACGQLALMCLNMTEINVALAKIGGTALTDGSYWSSSEYSSNLAWRVLFQYGYVFNNSKSDTGGRVRFIRDITPTKPLKERVSELESSKQDRIEDLDAIRDGASKGATALQPQTGGSGTKFLADDNTYKEIDIPEGDFATKEELEEKQDKVSVVDHGTEDTTFVLTPNILHKWGTVTSLTLTLAVPTDTTIANYYMAQFTCGSTATSINLPDTIKWITEPNIEANKTYQISILDNLGVIGGA